MKDLFEDYRNTPRRLKLILEKHEDAFIDGDYNGLAKALKEVEAEGYTFDYYLNGEAYGLRKIGTNLNELEGYEEFMDGGRITNDEYYTQMKEPKGSGFDNPFLGRILVKTTIDLSIDDVGEDIPEGTEGYIFSEPSDKDDLVGVDIKGTLYYFPQNILEVVYAKGGILNYGKPNTNEIKSFLKKYPKVEASMKPYYTKNINIMRAYRLWLAKKNESELGGREEIVKSKGFGTKTFYKFDWNGVSGWSEIFQYLYYDGKYAKGGALMSGDKKYFLLGYSAYASVDDYENGQSIEAIGGWDEKIYKVFKSKRGLVDYINEHIIGINYKMDDFDWDIGEGEYIQTSVLCKYEDYYGYIAASQEDIELWKNKKKELYILDYTINVHAAIPTEYKKGGNIIK
jgi:hypothetical protein